LTTTR